MKHSKIVSVGSHEIEIPERGYLRIHHLHPDNSSRKQRKGKKYLTVVSLYNEYNEILLQTTALCSNKDEPSRKRGLDIAISRMKKAIHMQEPHLFPEKAGVIRTLFSQGL